MEGDHRSGSHAVDLGIPDLTLALEDDTWLFTLPNGLSLILRPDRNAPVISAQAWCRTGSINEGRWLGGGLSHLLEHMLFKGTETRKPGSIDREVQTLGGFMNAYTSLDRTVYWINAPCEAAERVIDILSDIVHRATLPEEELEKEREVIRREMDMGEDDPSTVASRRLFELAFQVDPCRYPVIGHPDVFDRIGRDDLLAYYIERYSPGNIFFVLVGDIDPEWAAEQFLRFWSGVPRAPLPPEVLPTEPRQTAPREGVTEGSFELGHFHLGWHMPSVRHPDQPALDVLGTILGDGRSSRLYRKLREGSGLVHGIDAWTCAAGDTGLFGITAIAEGGQCAPAWEAVLEEVRRIREEGVSHDELRKALKIFQASTLGSRKTMEGQARDLGSSWMVARNLRFSEIYLEAARRLTPEAVQEVAVRYLDDAARNLAAVLPGGTRSRSGNRPAGRRERSASLHTLDNGLRLIAREDDRLPFVALRAVFQGGVLAEIEANEGITQLMSRLLSKGAGERDSGTLAEAIDSVGGTLETFAGRNSFGIGIEVLREDLPLGLEILSDMILRPVLGGEQLERERVAQLAGIRARRDQILHYGFQVARRALFGPSGYGLDPQGTVGSVEALSLERIREYYLRLRQPRNCVVAAYGHLDAARLRSRIEERLGPGAWVQDGEGFSLGDQEAFPPEGRVRRSIDKRQEVVIFAFRGTTICTPRAYALDLLEEACSDLGSRLFVRIREELGLAYSVGARHLPGRIPGYFAFYVLTSPGNARRVEEEVAEEIEVLRREGLDPEELERARAKVIGHKKLARQDLGSMASVAALDELLGFGFRRWEEDAERYREVTREDVCRACVEHFRPEGRVIVRVGPGD